ncbi:unnamed protein product [Lactuca virosa]|uniref:Reverse transcriptase zinc-binding domain-containing protein n=1 Tax=Lactuca virosa TaxID=75947 RepID=A0AAU9MNV9_9ASTR|nr:unnamed protein product [Lactuca virosa]
MSNRNITGVWHNIASIRNDVKKHGLDIGDIFQLQVQSGDNSQFWYDNWVGSGILKDKYPSLFELESRKRCTVADRFYDGSFEEHWNSCPSHLGLAADMDSLKMDLSNVELAYGDDKWLCKLNNNGEYTVCALRRKIDMYAGPQPPLPTITWSKEVPLKVNCFVWRALQNKIPASEALRFRGVDIASTVCGACIN